MRTFVSIVVSSALLVPGVVLACEGGTSKEGFRKIDVQGFLALREKGEVHLYDANSARTRQKLGIIPGATLLASPSEYDPDEVLPADKTATLVFYCANVHCTASHAAARRALEAGYRNVYVLSPGVKGWAEAGQPVERPTS